MEPQKRYVYRIKARNATALSPQSRWFDADTPSAPQPHTGAPAAPTNVFTAASHNQVRLNWDEPDDDTITGYRILRGAAAADSLAVIVDNTESTATAYTDVTVQAETTYFYAVRAINQAGEGEPSDAVNVTTTAAPNGEKLVTALSTHGVCGRTDEVAAAIVAAVSGVTACGDVTTTHLEEIMTLDISGSSIDSLSNGDFGGLSSLIVLNLYDNDLTILPEHVFDGLAALRTLHLYENDLTALPVDVFDGLTALAELTLGFNDLMTLPDSVFEDLVALELLDLGNNPGEPFAPVANVGKDQVVGTAAEATLDGSGSATAAGNPWGSNITYAWTQTGGEDVTLTGQDTAEPTFTAPDGVSELTFELTVTGAGLDVHSNPYTATASATVLTELRRSVELQSGSTIRGSVATDGTHVWVVETVGSTTVLVAYTLAGTRVSSKDATPSSLHFPFGVWTDGALLYLNVGIVEKIVVYAPGSTGTATAEYDFDITYDTSETNPRGIWSDGTTLWVLFSKERKLYAFVKSTGARDVDKDIQLESDILGGSENVRGCTATARPPGSCSLATPPCLTRRPGWWLSTGPAATATRPRTSPCTATTAMRAPSPRTTTRSGWQTRSTTSCTLIRCPTIPAGS